MYFFFFFSSRRRHTRYWRDWSSDVCSSDLTDIQKVEFLRSNGKRAEALEGVRAARRRFPEDLRLLRLEAQTLAELSRHEEALALLRPRLKGDASDFEEYLFMSSMLMSEIGR